MRITISGEGGAARVKSEKLKVKNENYHKRKEARASEEGKVCHSIYGKMNFSLFTFHFSLKHVTFSKIYVTSGFSRYRHKTLPL